MPDAVIFDLDGVLVDSEPLWDRAKQELVRGAGGRWKDAAQREMMGMSSPEWARYLHDELGVALPPEQINREVVSRLEQLYRVELPLLPGAVDAVRALSRRWPLGLASSANREIIDLVLELAELDDAFEATVSSEEVGAGKPAPDVYLEAARRLGAQPSGCVALEDSTSGLRAAAAAGMTVIAVPNPHYPPSEDALELAVERIATVEQLTPALVERATGARR
jgi:HAD superfamily hydrolase (TIGR01509 family)